MCYISVCLHMCVPQHVWRLEDNFLRILFYHLLSPILFFWRQGSILLRPASNYCVPENDIDPLILQLCFQRAGFRSVWPSGPAKVLRVDLCPHSELLNQLPESEEL